MFKFVKNPCNIYTIGWCLYYLQGTLYPFGSLIAKIILLLLLIYSLSICLKNRFFNAESTYFKGLNLILLIYTLYGIAHLMFGNYEFSITGQFGLDLLKPIYISILPIYVFYYFSKNTYLNDKWFSNWILIFVVVVICSFYREQEERIMMIAELGSQRDEVTNNTGYLFASLIPMLFFVKRNTWYQFGLLSVLLLFVVFAMKRGAILVGGLSAVIYIYYFIKTKKSIYKFGSIILIAIFIVLLFSKLENFILQSDYFNVRLQQTLNGDSSGRDTMYAQILDYFWNQTFVISFLVGSGLVGTLELLGNGAHNDWLEFAIDMGLLGVVVYFIYWRRFILVWLRYNEGDNIKYAMGVIIVSELLKTLFSFSINSLPIYEVILLGYCLSLINKTKKNEYNNRR